MTWKMRQIIGAIEMEEEMEEEMNKYQKRERENPDGCGSRQTLWETERKKGKEEREGRKGRKKGKEERKEERKEELTERGSGVTRAASVG